MATMDEKVKQLFRGRKLVIATMHGKEKVLAPLLSEALEVEIVLPAQLDTDVWGTFSGEVERTLSPYDAAIAKCNAAMQLTGADLAIANEGSFGPHPFIGFIPSDEELVVLMDRQHQLVIAAKELSTATNFDAQLSRSYEELIDFARRVKFPSHALILRKAKNDFSDVVKGVHPEDALKTEAEKFLGLYGQVFAETDMRALYNPSRMEVMAAAARKLLQKLFTVCDQCGTPGFDVKEVIPGLPCSYCATPTRSTLALLYECKHCHYKKRIEYPHGKTTEDPMYCDVCNP